MTDVFCNDGSHTIRNEATHAMWPLWCKLNNTVDSSPIIVNPGDAMLLVATGFKRKRVRIAQEETDAPQLACIARKIYMPDPEGKFAHYRPSSACDFIVEFGVQPNFILDVPVHSQQECCWSLSLCRNHGIIVLPGVYQLHFNDETMIGVAQVWAKRLKAAKLPHAFSQMIFQ